MKTHCIYVCRNLLAFLLSLFLLSAAVFYAARLAPGDPLVSYYGDHAEKMTPAERLQAEERLGLHEPIHIQYLCWLRSAARGDFGISYKYKISVLQVIGERLPNTLLLGGVSLLLIFTLALGLGILCTLQEGRWTDRLLCRAGTVLSCIPEFWLSLILILIFSVWLHWLPSSGAYSAGHGGDPLDRAAHLILPLSIVVSGHLWYDAYIIRSRLLTEIRAEYVLLAKAKGLSRKQILLRHCLRNIAPSCLNRMALSVPHILGGTYIVETVFSYPGIGTLTYESARCQDYNLLMVLSLFSGMLVILCSMLAQICSERLDPRLRPAPEPPADVPAPSEQAAGRLKRRMAVKSPKPLPHRR